MKLCSSGKQSCLLLIPFLFDKRATYVILTYIPNIIYSKPF